MQYYCSEKGNRLRWPTHTVAMAISYCCAGHRNTICCATPHIAKPQYGMICYIQGKINDKDKFSLKISIVDVCLLLPIEVHYDWYGL